MNAHLLALALKGAAGAAAVAAAATLNEGERQTA
jgi:hypothetical protein